MTRSRKCKSRTTENRTSRPLPRPTRTPLQGSSLIFLAGSQHVVPPTMLSNLARLRELRLRTAERTAALGFETLRAGEIDETVAVIDLNVQQNQHAKTERAGNLRTETIADVVHVESNEILAVILEMSKLEVSFFGAIHVTHFTAESLDLKIIVAAYLGHLFGGVRRNGVVKRSGIDQKKHRRGIIHFRGNQQCMTEPKNGRIHFHVRRNVTIVKMRPRGRLRFERGLRRGLVGIRRQLREFEFPVGKIDVHQIAAEDVGANQAIVIQHGISIDDVHIATLELQAPDLDGVRETHVPRGSALVANAARLLLDDSLHASFVRYFLVDQDSASAGIQPQLGGSAVHFDDESIAAKAIRAVEQSFEMSFSRG